MHAVWSQPWGASRGENEMSWDNPTDIETGAVQPNGAPWPETQCEDCANSDENGEPCDDYCLCTTCTYNPKNMTLEFDAPVFDNYSQREIDSGKDEPDDYDYDAEDKP